MILRLALWYVKTQVLRHCSGLISSRCDIVKSQNDNKAVKPRNPENPPELKCPATTSRLDSTASSTFLSNENGITGAPPIFNDLICFSRIKSQLAGNPNNRSARNELDGLLLDNLNHVGGSKSRLQNPAGYWASVEAIRSIQLSKILFSYAAFPSMSIAGAFSRSIAQALRMHIEAYLSGGNESHVWPCEILCWVLVSGASAVQEASNRAWFIACIGEFAAARHMKEFNELVQLLSSVIWVGGEFEYVCRAVWNDAVKGEFII